MKDRIAGVILLALAGLYWWEADAIPVTGFGGSVSAQGLPKLLAVGLAVTSALLILQSLATRIVAASKDAPDRGRWTLANHARAGGILAIGVGYIFLVESVGYALAVLAVLFATAVYMGQRLSLTLVSVAIGGAIVFWVIFAEILNIPLPKGILPL
jgi:putative tricarboxylic transport membrane protein